MKTKTSFSDIFSFPGFRARSRFKCGVLGDPAARVVKLVRRQKKTSAPVAIVRYVVSGTVVFTAFETWMQRVLISTWTLNTAALIVRIAA